MVKMREQWTTSLAFILAAAGSAVGLGNIWRFSYVTGTNGGAAFILIYLLAIIIIGYPLVMTEISIGRKTQKNPIGAFWAMAPNTPWWLIGAMGVTAGFVIMSFYSIVAGWSLAYIFKSLSGFTSDMDFAGTFVGHITSVWPPIIWHAIFAGYVWTSKKACKEMNTPECVIFVGTWYGFLIRYIVPVPIAVIMIVGLYQKFTG